MSDAPQQQKALPEPRSRGLVILNWVVGVLFILVFAFPLIGIAMYAGLDCTGGFAGELSCGNAFMTTIASFFGFFALSLISPLSWLIAFITVILALVGSILEFRHAKRIGKGPAAALKSVSFVVLVVAVLGILFFVF